MLTAIIVAAGSSKRVGFDKLFSKIGERSVLEHALAAFEEAAPRLMGDKDWQANYQKIGSLVESGSREIFTLVA